MMAMDGRRVKRDDADGADDAGRGAASKRIERGVATDAI